MDTNNENIITRPAVNEDLPQLNEFLQSLVEAERPFDPTLKDGKIFYYEIQDLILNKETEILVIEVDNEIVGSGYAQIRSGKPFERYELFGYLGFMYVKPEFRGRGLNNILLNELKKWILSKGINEVRLQVYSENDAAVRAYEKAGFKKILTTMRCEIN